MLTSFPRPLRGAANVVHIITWFGLPLARRATFIVMVLAVAAEAAATALAEAPEGEGVAATAIEAAAARHRASKRKAGLFAPLQLEPSQAATARQGQVPPRRHV